MTSRMTTQADTWQVHNCGPSNWPAGDIRDWPKPGTVCRQDGNEKNKSGLLIHDTMLLAFSSIKAWYQGMQWTDASPIFVLFFQTVLLHIFLAAHRLPQPN